MSPPFARGIKIVTSFTSLFLFLPSRRGESKGRKKKRESSPCWFLFFSVFVVPRLVQVWFVSCPRRARRWISAALSAVFFPSLLLSLPSFLSLSLEENLSFTKDFTLLMAVLLENVDALSSIVLGFVGAGPGLEVVVALLLLVGVELMVG